MDARETAALISRLLSTEFTIERSNLHGAKVFDALFASDKISQNFDKRFNIKHLDVIKLMVR